jgi:CRP-like cAMP-binding protein
MDPAPATFLSFLSAEERRALLAIGAHRHFARRALLMSQGAPDDSVMILTDGRVKVARLGPDGRELLLAVRDPGELLGELGYIDHQPRSANVVALEAASAVVVARDAFRAHLEASPRAAVLLVELLASRVRETTLKAADFATADTMGRLASRIVELAERYGRPVAGGIDIEMPLSQEELAAWAGASRAGASQALQAMRQLGWIDTRRGWLLVRAKSALEARSP